MCCVGTAELCGTYAKILLLQILDSMQYNSACTGSLGTKSFSMSSNGLVRYQYKTFTASDEVPHCPPHFLTLPHLTKT